jgi:hypothetical protein
MKRLERSILLARAEAWAISGSGGVIGPSRRCPFNDAKPGLKTLVLPECPVSAREKLFRPDPSTALSNRKGRFCPLS